MLTYRAQRRSSLIALFVLVWGLVFPALAQAGVGETNAVWAEICTAQGIKKVQQGGESGHASGHHYSAEHCALCCLGGALAAVEAVQLFSGIGFEPPTLQLPLLHVALPQQIILLNAPPRAPPFLPLV
jgi:hypothetical protein